jgi:hypothetical protein
MREATWLRATTVTPMLDHLRKNGSERKLRLFACACCRLFWPLLRRESSRRAVEVAERYADGLADRTALVTASKSATPDILRWPSGDHAGFAAANAARCCLYTDAWTGARGTSGAASQIGVRQEQQVLLLRELCGNPFRPPLPLDPAWLTANDGAALELARAVYDQRAFDRLPILADALEEAGCTDAELLAHCRQSGEHARGCWVVDRVLGKT